MTKRLAAVEKRRKPFLCNIIVLNTLGEIKRRNCLDFDSKRLKQTLKFAAASAIVCSPKSVRLIQPSQNLAVELAGVLDHDMVSPAVGVRFDGNRDARGVHAVREPKRKDQIVLRTSLHLSEWQRNKGKSMAARKGDLCFLHLDVNSRIAL